MKTIQNFNHTLMTKVSLWFEKLETALDAVGRRLF